MKPEIKTINEKKLIGIKLTMSFANYRIGELWQRFMPARREISNALNSDLISMVIYKPDHFTDFQPTNEFERWAAMEVSAFENVPDTMETFTLPGGLYAVFHYKGLNTDTSVFQNIYGTWLPVSEYELDNRPHFELLGDQYKNNDPDSEEEIWVPVRKKS